MELIYEKRNETFPKADKAYYVTELIMLDCDDQSYSDKTLPVNIISLSDDYTKITMKMLNDVSGCMCRTFVDFRRVSDNFDKIFSYNEFMKREVKCPVSKIGNPYQPYMTCFTYVDIKGDNFTIKEK